MVPSSVIRCAVWTVAFAGALLIPACGGGDAPTAAEEQPADLVVELTTTTALGQVVPGQVILGRVRGAVVPKVGLTGRIGTVATVTPVRLDDSTVAMLVPAVGEGAQEWRLRFGRVEAAGTLPVSAAPTIADHTAYLNNATQEVAATLDSIAAAEPQPGVDAAQLGQDLTALRAQLAQARARIAAASPAERQQAAAFLAANADVLGRARAALLTRVGSRRPTNIAARADGSATMLQTETAAAPCASATTYEAMSADLDAFGTQSVLRLLGLVAVTTLAFSAGGPVVGILVAVPLIYIELSRIQSQVFACYLTPVIGEVTGGSPSQAALVPEGPRPAHASVIADEPPVGAFALAVTPTRFERERRSRYDVMAEYRNVTAADAGTPALGAVVNTARDIDALIGRIRSLLRMGAATSVLPAGATRRVTAPVPTRYLSLGAVSPATVQGAASDSAGHWMLQFDAASITEDIPVQITIRYGPPGRAAQTTSRAVTLTPDSVGIYTRAVQGEWAWVATQPSGGTPVDVTFRANGTATYRYPTPSGQQSCGPQIGSGNPQYFPTPIGGYCHYQGAWSIQTTTRDGKRRYYLSDRGFFRAGTIVGAIVEPLTMPLSSFSVTMDAGSRPMERTYTRR